MLTTLWCILYNCSREKQLISHTLTLATAQSPGSQLLMENSISELSPSLAGNWFLFCFLKMWCKKQSRCLHALHSDLCHQRCSIPLHTCQTSSFVRDHNVIWVFVGETFFSTITHIHWASLPLLSTSSTPGRAAASAREGSFAPRAPQEQHICQETWCQYLPGAL